MSRRVKGGAAGRAEQGGERSACDTATPAELVQGDGSSILEHDALPLLLQHRSVCRYHQDIICRLLCTSKAMHAAVTSNCAGQLHLHAWATTKKKKKAKWFIPWLGKHAGALQSLSLELNNNRKKESAVETALAAALQKAAAGAATAAHGLQLRSLSAQYASQSIHVLLQQLPANTLTCLRLDFEGALEDSQPAAAALAALTALRKLTLECGGDGILTGCTALTNLEHLTVRPLDAVHQLRLVPPQLKGLSFGTSRKQHLQQAKLQQGKLRWSKRHKLQEQQLLQLGHITGLTKLSSTGLFGEQGMYVVMQDDVLPPNVQYMSVRDVPLVKPLLQLRQLRNLHMSNSSTPAAQLQQLSTLTQLTEINMTYSGGYTPQGDIRDAVDGAAAAWPLLPLSSLAILGGGGDKDDPEYGLHMSAASVYQLGKVTGLTNLELFGIEHLAATADQLAAALQQLTSLRSLRLGGRAMLKRARGSSAASDEDSDDDEPRVIDVEPLREKMRAVFSGIAKLTGLRNLSIGYWFMNGIFETSVVDSLAPQLVALELEKAALQDEDVQAIAVKFTQLKKLILDGNSMLTESVLPALLQLPKLVVLSVEGTAIGKEAAEKLKVHMKQLKLVQAGSILYGMADGMMPFDLQQLTRGMAAYRHEQLMASSSSSSSSSSGSDSD